MSGVYDEIYKIVQSIPKGRVLTYGIISHMIGGRMSAQGVGWALKALGSAKKTEAKAAAKQAKAKPAKASGATSKTAKTKVAQFTSDNVPWQRVVNAQGGTSTHKVKEVPPNKQRELLEAEGIVFDEEGKMDLNKYLWTKGLNKFSSNKV